MTTRDRPQRAQRDLCIVNFLFGDESLRVNCRTRASFIDARSKRRGALGGGADRRGRNRGGAARRDLQLTVHIGVAKRELCNCRVENAELQFERLDFEGRIVNFEPRPWEACRASRSSTTNSGSPGRTL